MQHFTPPELSASQLLQVDELCNAFEQAFQSGQSPRAEDYLAKADESLRRVLLPELLQLELHYRPDCSRAELGDRFPQLEQTWLAGTTASTDEKGFPTIPGYFIMEELGRGGMGIVYLAADLNLHRHVALKMLHQSSRASSEHRRRFLGEARAVARLQHPNLVQIFDSGDVDGHPFLVFELVDGGTLAQRLPEYQMTFAESAELIATLSGALQFAHDRHIIHRDLKPSNILLGNDGVPRISDFGLAKRLDEDSRQTISGQVIGTPSYMAPEQAEGLAMASSPSVDIYALGAILYELLTGRPPFRAASVMETLEQLRTTDPVPPRRIRDDIPRDLETICLKCLCKEPARRYISAQVLADEIGRYRRGESIIARPVGSVARAGRWCARHPLPTSLAAALLLVTVAGFIGVSSQWKKAVRQQELAEMNAAKFRMQRDRAVGAIAQAEAYAGEAEHQRMIAEAHAAAAESRFEKAQEPILELIALGKDLVLQPQMEARGRQALKNAARFRQALLEEKSDDPKVRYDTACTVQRLAWTLLEHGIFEEAEASYGQALTVLQELHRDDPRNGNYLRQLRSLCLERGATLQHLLRSTEAEQSCRDCVDYAEKILKTSSYTATDQIDLGNALTNWAGTLNSVGRPAEALEALQRSIHIHRKVTSHYPDIERYQESLALALTNIAVHLWATDRDASVAASEEAVEIRRSRIKKAKAPRDEAMYLIRSLNALTDRYIFLGRMDDAEQLVAEASGHAEAAKVAFPAFFGVRNAYIRTLEHARQLAVKRNDRDRAEAVLHRIQEELKTAVKEFPDDITMKRWAAFYPFQQAMMLVDGGNHQEAMKLLVQSLGDLRQLQSESSSPREFRSNIITVARSFGRVGSRFDFEREKQEAARERVVQDPENASAHNSLAWRLVCVSDDSLRDAGAAEQSVRRAIELTADQPFYHNTLGVALYYQDRLDEAAEEFERSLDLQTSVPAGDWCYLAMIHSRQAEPRKATEFLEKARSWQQEHRPDDEELQLILNEAAALRVESATAD